MIPNEKEQQKHGAGGARTHGLQSAIHATWYIIRGVTRKTCYRETGNGNDAGALGGNKLIDIALMCGILVFAYGQTCEAKDKESKNKTIRCGHRGGYPHDLASRNWGIAFQAVFYKAA